MIKHIVIHQGDVCPRSYAIVKYMACSILIWGQMCHIIHFRLCGWREIEKGHWGAGAKMCESERERAWESVYSAVRWDLSLWCEGREDSAVSGLGGWGGGRSLTLFPSHTHMHALTRLTNSPTQRSHRSGATVSTQRASGSILLCLHVDPMPLILCFGAGVHALLWF